LEKTLREEILQVYSEECINCEGVIILNKKAMNSLTPAGQRQEVLGMVSKESETLGDSLKLQLLYFGNVLMAWINFYNKN
jgi:hypothetical protein